MLFGPQEGRIQVRSLGLAEDLLNKSHNISHNFLKTRQSFQKELGVVEQSNWTKETQDGGTQDKIRKEVKRETDDKEEPEKKD